MEFKSHGRHNSTGNFMHNQKNFKFPKIKSRLKDITFMFNDIESTELSDLTTQKVDDDHMKSS
jgi:hypothetical protein